MQGSGQYGRPLPAGRFATPRLAAGSETIGMLKNGPIGKHPAWSRAARARCRETSPPAQKTEALERSILPLLLVGCDHRFTLGTGFLEPIGGELVAHLLQASL